MHEDEHTKIILEKSILAKSLVACCLFSGRLARDRPCGSSSLLGRWSFYGLLFLVLLGKYIFKDLSDSENIVITPSGSIWARALVQSKSIGVIWASCTQRHILPVIAVQADMVKWWWKRTSSTSKQTALTKRSILTQSIFPNGEGVS